MYSKCERMHVCPLGSLELYSFAIIFTRMMTLTDTFHEYFQKVVESCEITQAIKHCVTV